LNYSVREDAGGLFVVKLNGGRTLRMAHFVESGAHRYGIFGVDETWAYFRFLDRGHDRVDKELTRIRALSGGAGFSGLMGSFGLSER
jgi:hypothetical protein